MKFLIRGRGQGMGVKKCTDNFNFTINILPLHAPKKLEWGNSMTIILIWIVKKYCLPEKNGRGRYRCPLSCYMPDKLHVNMNNSHVAIIMLHLACMMSDTGVSKWIFQYKNQFSLTICNFHADIIISLLCRHIFLRFEIIYLEYRARNMPRFPRCQQRYHPVNTL